MKFSMGLWDQLFGKKITLHLPDKEGNEVERVVTKKWIDEMMKQKKMDYVIKVHLLDPVNLYQQVHWKVGEDVDQDLYEKFKTEKNELYVVKLVENNEIDTLVVKPEVFEEMYQKMKEVDDEPVTQQIKANVFDEDRGMWESMLTIGEEGIDIETVEKYRSEENELYIIYVKDEHGEKDPKIFKKEQFIEYLDYLAELHHQETESKKV